MMDQKNYIGFKTTYKVKKIKSLFYLFSTKKFLNLYLATWDNNGLFPSHKEQALREQTFSSKRVKKISFEQHLGGVSTFCILYFQTANMEQFDRELQCSSRWKIMLLKCFFIFPIFSFLFLLSSFYTEFQNLNKLTLH